jgi:hypothetical protein
MPVRLTCIPKEWCPYGIESFRAEAPTFPIISGGDDYVLGAASIALVRSIQNDLVTSILHHPTELQHFHRVSTGDVLLGESGVRKSYNVESMH